jgi:hypothetical protein
VKANGRQPAMSSRFGRVDDGREVDEPNNTLQRRRASGAFSSAAQVACGPPRLSVSVPRFVQYQSNYL